ncbi:MAG TPA: phosphoribosylamine--glycine ligase [Baekduia sp.]|nr:phosphoribosylamine--glycine ligase [Baekduia sp.]
MKILVIGGGGREHAIVRALKRSPQAPELLCIPGNPGIAEDARCIDMSLEPADVVAFAQGEEVDLVVVGPEAPLVAGMVDAFAGTGIKAFGPSAQAARLEASKSFSKDVMIAAGVPTGGYEEVGSVAAGMAAIDSYPAVIKYDGLAAGKGVVIAQSESEARAALAAMIEERRFGTGKILVEEYLDGDEVSLFALCDGVRAIPMTPAQDYKRIFDGDQGPNTGGMGAYTPVPGVPDVDELCALVHQPIVDEMARRGTPFHGVLYAGLMLTADGVKVLEYNCRFGDPETQAVLPRLKSDLVDLLARASVRGGLEGASLQWSERFAVTIVLASAGYPVSSSSGDVITGLAAAASGAEVTHAGTAIAGSDVVTAGGRVLNVTALGVGPEGAREAAYAAADKIAFAGMQCRRDIALRAAERVI